MELLLGVCALVGAGLLGIKIDEGRRYKQFVKDRAELHRQIEEFENDPVRNDGSKPLIAHFPIDLEWR